MDDRTSPAEFELIRKMAEMADAVTVSAFIRVGANKDSIDLNGEQVGLLRHLSGLKRPFVLTLLGSPHLLQSAPELPGYVLTYETHPAAELAAVRAITGEIEFRGRLPVSLPGFHDLGHRDGP